MHKVMANFGPLISRGRHCPDLFAGLFSLCAPSLRGDNLPLFLAALFCQDLQNIQDMVSCVYCWQEYTSVRMMLPHVV